MNTDILAVFLIPNNKQSIWHEHGNQAFDRTNLHWNIAMHLRLKNKARELNEKLKLKKLPLTGSEGAWIEMRNGEESEGIWTDERDAKKIPMEEWLTDWLTDWMMRGRGIWSYPLQNCLLVMIQDWSGRLCNEWRMKSAVAEWKESSAQIISRDRVSSNENKSIIKTTQK